VPAAVAPSGPIDPFRMASVSTAEVAGDLEQGPDLAETTLNLVLHGTWITEDGGAAFIKTPDEKQGRYAIGDTITNGVTLEKVYRDQVVINRNGARESLRLINREQIAPVNGTSAPPQDSKIKSNINGLASIGQLISAQPELDDVGNVRLVLQPADDEEAFQDLGLRSGDVLVAVDNQPIGPDIAAGLGLIAAIEGKPSVTISIQRDGVVMPVTIALPNTETLPND
ncbi:MAG: type II secretion system protein N, partial [Pseudomonadota bacterium]